MFGTRLVALSFGLLALSRPCPGAQPAPGDDPVVAVVDGAELRRSEVEALARSLPEQYRQVPLPQIYGMLLDRAIDFRLLANAAEGQDLAEDPEVQTALAQARAGVLRDAYVRQQIEEQTTEDKLRARYEEMKDDEGFTQEEVHARHILVGSEAEATEVIAALAGGAEFAALATERSVDPSARTNSGDLGFFRREQMVPSSPRPRLPSSPASTPRSRSRASSAGTSSRCWSGVWARRPSRRPRRACARRWPARW